MSIEVRRLARGDEAEFVTGLEWLFAPPGRRPADWDDNRGRERAAQVLADDHAAVFAAHDADGRLIGLVSVYLDILSVRWGRRASIEDLAVHPDGRSRGVGAALLATAKSWAEEHRADYVFLESGVARTDAHRFYQREGWTQAAAAFRWTFEASHADRGSDRNVRAEPPGPMMEG